MPAKYVLVENLKGGEHIYMDGNPVVASEIMSKGNEFYIQWKANENTGKCVFLRGTKMELVPD